jgi:hypothetical protein
VALRIAPKIYEVKKFPSFRSTSYAVRRPLTLRQPVRTLQLREMAVQSKGSERQTVS